MFRTESTLGLVASILCVIGAALLLIGLLAAILFAGTAQWFFENCRWGMHMPYYFHDFMAPGFAGMAAGLVSLSVGVLLVFKAAAAVLGFVGVSQLNRDNRNGGVLLLLGAGLSLLSGGFISMVLLLIGGVLALSKRGPAQPPPATQD
jgi:hypothetical protein